MQKVETFYHASDFLDQTLFNKRPGKDAGYDIVANEDLWLWPLQTKVVPSTCSVHIPKGLLGRVTGRSGKSSKGWLTHAGTVDHGYSGNVGVIVTNLSFLPRKIKKGDRIAQLIFMPFCEADLHLVRDEDNFRKLVQQESNSTRGTQGYGSSD